MFFKDFSNLTQFKFNVSGKELRVVDFDAEEEISVPYSVELTLASEEEINFDDVVGQDGLLTIFDDQKQLDRYFHGIINQFELKDKTGRFFEYEASIVPKLKLLELEQDCRIFQSKSTQDIVTQILEESNILTDQFEFRLIRECEPREYSVQYRETDLNFISRLVEEEGIFYFFEHFEDKHLLIFTDLPRQGHIIKGEPEIPFNYGKGMVHGQDFVNSFTLSRQICSGKATLKDFNFEKPALDLKVEFQDALNQNLEIYDYPGPHSLQAQGNPLVKNRLEEAVTFKEIGSGKSICPRFAPGFTFTLIDHDNQSLNQEYLIVSVSHSGDQPQIFEEESQGAGFSYSNDFVVIPSSVQFRPKRITPKPIVRGVQTAIVTGPGAEEIYTDKHGRVKVQFHWDREGENNDKSSCWIRVSQLWAGTNWGAMYIPRVGQEVIVDFLEGNPDRPIITGRVYHATNIPPYQLPANKTKSTIKSRSTPNDKGSNEIRFEDKKGEEEIFIHAQKDQNEVVENNMTTTVKANQTISIGADRFLTVEKNRTTTIKKENETLKVEEGERTVEISTGNEIHKNGADFTHQVQGNFELKVNGNLTIDVSGTATIKGATIQLNP